MRSPKLGGWAVPGKPPVIEPDPTYEELLAENDALHEELAWYNDWATDLLAKLSVSHGDVTELLKQAKDRLDQAKAASQTAGDKRRAKADVFWQPWEARYQELSETKPRREIIGIIAREMDCENAFPPGKSEPPVEATIRARMKKADLFK